MIYIIIAQLIAVVFFGWCFYVNVISLDAKSAGICKRLLLFVGAAGVLGCVLSAVLFSIAINRSDINSLVSAVVSDSYVMFVATDTVFIAVGLFITLVSSLLKSRLRPVIPVLIPMWMAISLFWTLACSVWSDFADINASYYVIIYGISVAFTLSFAAIPQTVERHKVLSDRKMRGEIINKRKEKITRRKIKAMERNRLNEKKKRLKGKNKK